MRSILEEFEGIASIESGLRSDPFILLNKQKIVIEKEDNSNFRNFKWFYSDSLAYTSVQVKLEDRSNIQYKLSLFQ